jgi:hypothetical protein
VKNEIATIHLEMTSSSFSNKNLSPFPVHDKKKKNEKNESIYM